MSILDIPTIKQMEEQLEEQARRESEKYRELDASSTKQHDLSAKTSPKKEESPKILLDQQIKQCKNANIFTRRPENDNRVNIFSNNKSVNLFSIAQQNTSKPINIFQKAQNSKPSVNNLQDDDLNSQNSRSVSNTQEQQLKQPVQKVMKYNYEKGLEKIAEFKLIKFRAGTGTTKEMVTLSIQRDEKIKGVLYFILRNQTTLLTVYNAFVLKGVKIAKFMGREENLTFSVIRQKKDEKNKGERQQVKLQFSSSEQANKFSTLLETTLNSQ